MEETYNFQREAVIYWRISENAIHLGAHEYGSCDYWFGQDTEVYYNEFIKALLNGNVRKMNGRLRTRLRMHIFRLKKSSMRQN